MVGELDPGKNERARSGNAKQLFVVLACVISENRVLLTQRYEPGLPELHLQWELPGGKVDISETPEAAVVREVREETGYEVEVTDPRPFGYTTPHWSHSDGTLRAVLLGYECSLVDPKRVPDWKPDPKIAQIEWRDLSQLDPEQILGGSRELILWILQRRDSPQNMTPVATNTFSIDLEHRNATTQSFKYYRLSVDIDPESPNAYTLTRKWGRLGRDGQSIKESLGTESQLRQRLQVLIKDQASHGYRVKAMSDYFPLRSWVLENIGAPPRGEVQMSFLDDTDGTVQDAPDDGAEE